MKTTGDDAEVLEITVSKIAVYHLIKKTYKMIWDFFPIRGGGGERAMFQCHRNTPGRVSMHYFCLSLSALMYHLFVNHTVETTL